MKITSKRGIHNVENCAGFINIKDWEGSAMIINVEYLKNALKAINILDDIGMDMETIHIGVAPPTKEAIAGLFCVFLDPNKTVAYAIAGKDED